MPKKGVKQRIEKLKEVINYHRYLYHVLDRQEISDAALDSLKHELYQLEKENPGLITLDSPTQRIGGRPLAEFKKVRHEVPMLSIEDIFSEKELRDWQDYLRRLEPASQLEYFAELKIDGFAIELIYENNILKSGSTRGDGLIGENVTQNIKTIESVPLKLESDNQKFKIPERFIVRGEVYMAKKDFERFNQELAKKGEKTFANPRNLAAGSIRQLDPKLAASRPLKFLAYDILTDIGQNTHSQEHQILPLLGFRTDPGTICKNLSDILNFWQEIDKKRENLPFQIDGVVVSVNDNSLFRKLRVVGKSPRAIRAFKFSPKQATTRILDIKIQVGRTGAITPVAVLEPVEAGGVTITRATLHNEDEIKKLGVKIGDTVIIERAGDVIPVVAKVIPELRSGQEKEFHFPQTCPVCLTRLSRPEGEAVWRCKNLKCPARKRENLYYFASKKAFGIKGLGPKIIDQLANENLISESSDIFQLKEGDLLLLERFGEKSTRNLIQSIQQSKKIPLSKFIFALGIRHVGEETAVDLANHLGSVEKLKTASQEKINKIPDIGEKIAANIYQWFQQKQNLKLIDNLISSGIEIIPPPKISKKLQGKIFVLTGLLETMTREAAKEKIRLLGGDVSESISPKTNYLLLGREPGSKLEKAKKLGIKIMTEKQFLDLIK